MFVGVDGLDISKNYPYSRRHPSLTKENNLLRVNVTTSYLQLLCTLLGEISNPVFKRGRHELEGIEELQIPNREGDFQCYS